MQIDEALKVLYKADTEKKTLFLDFYRPGEKDPFLSLSGPKRINDDSLKITEALCSDENLTFGSCEATQFEITLIDVEEDLKGAIMVAYQTLSLYTTEELYPVTDLYPYEELYPANSAIEIPCAVPLGKYIVQTAERGTNRRHRDIVALDFMTKFDVDVIDWYNSLEFPMLLQDFRASLCAYVGVTESVPADFVNDDMIVEKTIDAAELMGRDVLTACEQINGTFGHFGRDGVLQHITLDKTASGSGGCDENMESYLCISERHEDYTVNTIGKVRIFQEEGDVGTVYGDGTNCYSVEGNFLLYGKTAAELETVAANIYGMVSGRCYVPVELRCKGLPYLEVGASLWIDREGIFTYLMKRTLTGVYALKDDISSTGEEIRITDSNILTEIVQLKGRTAVIKKSVEEVSVSVTNLANNTAAQFKIMSDEIKLKVSEGDVTNQLNSELSITGHAIALRTGNFTIESKNLTIDADGNADFSGRVTGSSFEGGIIEVGVFYADDEDVRLGDWYVSSDGSNIFRSRDGSVSFQTAAGGPFGKYATLVLTGESGTTTVSDHHVESALIDATTRVITPAVDGYDPDDPRYSYFYDIELGRSWWDGDSITDTVRTLWESCDGVSDERAKMNIESVDPAEAIAFLLNAHPVTFQYKRDGKWSAGFIAQEIEETMNEMEMYYPIVGTDQKTGLYKVDYRTYIPLLVATVQNLQMQISEIRGEV